MGIGNEEVKRVAELAALDIDPGSLPLLAEQIGQILDYVSQLQGLDCPADISDQPLQEVDAAPLRDDDVTNAPCDVRVEEIAPEMTDRLFLVPKVSAALDT